MAVILKNNAKGKLAATLNTTATKISLQGGQGALFPSPTGGDFFPLTIIKPTGELEIVYCTKRVGDVLTVTRAREGTSAKAFSTGDRCSLRFTAGVWDSVSQLASRDNHTGTQGWKTITGVPATATRWPTFNEVTGRPANYPTTWGSVAAKPVQATRWPNFNEVTKRPTNYPTTWNSVASKPAQATRWPTWGEVSGKPAIPTLPKNTLGAVGTYALGLANGRTGAAGEVLSGIKMTTIGIGQGSEVGGFLVGSWRVMGSRVNRKEAGILLRIS